VQLRPVALAFDASLLDEAGEVGGVDAYVAADLVEGDAAFGDGPRRPTTLS
jgi:hypothetical protein